MAQTVANLTDVLKEAWTSDRLEKQFYDENPFLDRVSKFEATTIGEKAIVPIHNGRSGGYTSTLAAGGNLNPAGQQEVDAAEYTLPYHYFSVKLEAAAIAQAAGGDSSVVVSKDLELKGSIADTRKQITRQLVTNSDGIIAACDTGGASTTVELLVDSSTSYGYQSLVRGWLHEGMVVDIGATSNTDSIVTGATVTAISESSTDPDITIDSSVSTTSGTDFVYIANPNSATLANPEVNGLRSMVGSTTSALGGLDPDTAGEAFWKPAHVDTATTVLSLNLLLTLRRKVHQKTGSSPTYNLTSLKQEQAFYELLHNQVRYQNEPTGAGKVSLPSWNGMEIHAQPDVLDQDWFCLTIEDFIKIVPKAISKPTWATDIAGKGGSLQWTAGTTGFENAVMFPMQVGLKRRNSSHER
jgi:hypothetical protein